MFETVRVKQSKLVRLRGSCPRGSIAPGLALRGPLLALHSRLDLCEEALRLPGDPFPLGLTVEFDPPLVGCQGCRRFRRHLLLLGALLAQRRQRRPRQPLRLLSRLALVHFDMFVFERFSSTKKFSSPKKILF